MTGNIRRGLTRMQALAKCHMHDQHVDKWTKRELVQAILWIERQITGKRYARTRHPTKKEFAAARREIKKLMRKAA